MGGSEKHPQHDRLSDEVRSWYRTSAPQLGYHLVARRFGFYRHDAEHPDAGRVIVEALKPDEIPQFLADASSYFENTAVHIWLDDEDRDAALGPSLIAAGCAIDKAITYLAHVGPRPDRFHLSNLTVEGVTPETLMDYALVKLKGFANSEDEPPAKHLGEELAARGLELASMGRFLIARVRNEPAAILGYYEGDDRLIFNLATRTPFRMSGIARQLLCGIVADSYDQGCRSVIINTNPDDTPIQWYRRLGFTDEVYWRRNYVFDPASALNPH